MLTSVFATDKQRRLEQLQQDAKPGHPLRTPSEQALRYSQGRQMADALSKFSSPMPHCPSKVVPCA
eukprot:scaffold104196_cov22-Tisochrysis_lutea.AAC.3